MLKLKKLVEDVEFLLPVKFRCISFCRFRGEIEHVSANQTLARPSCFFNKPEHKHLVEDVGIFILSKFR